MRAREPVQSADLVEEPEHVDVLDTPKATETAIRGSAQRTMGYMLAALANALVLPFLFRYLGVVRAGEYVTVLSLMTILAGLVEGGLTGISLRIYTGAPPRDRRRLLQNLLSMRIFMLLLAVGVVLCFAALAQYPRVIFVGIVLGSVGVTLEGIGSTYNVWLAANLKQGLIAASNVIRQAVVAVVTLALIIIKARFVLFFAAYIPAGLSQMLVSAVASRRSRALFPSGDARTWLHMAWENATYVAAMALGFVYFRIPMILMSLIAARAATGYFGVAYRIVDTLTLTTIILTGAVPILTRAAHQNMDRYIHGLERMVHVSVTVGGGLAVLTSAGAPVAIGLLGGHQFTPSVRSLELLSIVLAVRFLTVTWGFGLLAVGSFRSLLVANSVATCFSVLCGIVAIPLIGIYGGVVATIGAEVSLAVVYGLVLRNRESGTQLPVRTALCVLAAVACGAATLLVPMPALLRPWLAVGIYVGVLAVTGQVPQEALHALPRPLRVGLLVRALSL